MGNYKFQILGIIIMIIFLINYFKNKRLPLMSTKIFSVFLIFGTLNLIFDASTVYTITHMDTVPGWLNRLCHQLYIGSLNTVIFLLYNYVMILSKEQKRFSPANWIIRGIPYLISMGFVIFSPLYYYIDEEGFYSYGLMTYGIFANIGVYMCLIAYTLVVNKTISGEKRALIGIGMFSWVANAIVQLLFPKLLFSTVGVITMVTLVYLSIENPREYADKEIGTLNRIAFRTILPEMIESKKKFYVVNFVVDEAEYVKKVFGYKEAVLITAFIAKRISKVVDYSIYHYSDCELALVITDEEIINNIEKIIEENTFEYCSSTGNKFIPKYHVYVIECPRFAKSPDEIYDIMDYTKHKHKTEDRVIFVDKAILDEHIRYRAIQKLVEKAVKEDGFEVFYQPIFSNESKNFASAEALVRLKDTTTLGFISPEIFIPIAEKKGLIGALGDIVFDKVCSFMEREQLYKYGVHYIEVNLSGIQCVDPNLVDKLTACMKKHNIQPEWINLEITETAAVEAGKSLNYNMNELRKYGCHFSMDDFGTGFSNLSQMAKVKYELIKLDKSLIWPCFEDNGEDAIIILKNCVEMILNLGSKMVAEGVETEEQANMLTKLGVTYLQGYYFSKPIAEGDYIQLLMKR